MPPQPLSVTISTLSHSLRKMWAVVGFTGQATSTGTSYYPYVTYCKNSGTISGTYTFSDGKTKIDYVGSYELDFLKFYDLELKGSPLGLIECPFTFEYEYEKKRYYDF